MIIPVTRDKDNLTDMVMLDMAEVIYMHLEGRNIVYHTLQEQFYHLLPSLTVMAKHMEDLGFRKLDRINLVNIHQIKFLDTDQSKVFFEEPIVKESKYATVSFLNRGKHKKEIKEWISSNSKNGQISVERV